MKFVLLGFAALASTHGQEIYKSDTVQVDDYTLAGINEFGSSYFQTMLEDGTRHKEITFSGKPFMSTVEERYNWIKEATELAPIAAQRQKDGTISKCQGRPGDGHSGMLEFAPALSGIATVEKPKFTYTEGLCFKKLDFELSFQPSVENFEQATLTVDAQE